MEHDRLFKELLRNFFIEFLDLFFPEVVRNLTRDSIEFLDKEIFTDIASSERHEVDLLVKARFRRKEAFFLIHVENQATSQEAFGQRMFRYFARLHEKHQLPVYPIVIFSYDSPRRPAANRYEIAFAQFNVLAFHYRVIQLNRLNWRQFLEQPNPVASALMVKMRIPPEDRPRVKVECLRMIVKLNLNKARSTLIWEFMTSYLRLTPAEEVVYNTGMATLTTREKETALELSNELREGGARDLLTRQLQHRLGKVPAELLRRLSRLSENEIRDIGVALFDFKNFKDVYTLITRLKKQR
jgi:hypothetical protein